MRSRTSSARSAERLRAEAGIEYGPHMRAPLGRRAGRVAQRA